MVFLLFHWEACTDQIISALILGCIHREMRKLHFTHIKDIILIAPQEMEIGAGCEEIKSITGSEISARRPVVADQTSSETVDPHVKHHVCALLCTTISSVDITLDRSVLSSYPAETFRAGGHSRVFNVIQWLLQARHERTIHIRRNAFRNLSLSWYRIS